MSQQLLDTVSLVYTMASNTMTRTILLILTLSFACFEIAISGDPDILSDFVVPLNVNLDGNFFTYTGFRPLLTSKEPTNFTVTKASKAEFPALDGQSVSYAFLQYPPSGLNPPHTHPRGSELLFLLNGRLEVGLVDTTNKLYTQTLQKGDMFIFPKGLVHYQFNPDPSLPVIAVSAFGSASAGTVSVPATIFATGIDSGILAKAFKTDAATIQHIKAGFGQTA